MEANLQVSNEQLINNLSTDLERTGELLKQEFKQLSELAQQRIDSKINCAKFEGIYGITVSKQQRVQTMKNVREVRASLWNESLKKAQGNPKIAYSFYKEICDFD